MAEEDLVQELVVTPSQEQQVFDSPGGYGPVTVKAVTSAIDNNIKSENIKTGVSILGVLGSFPDVGDGFDREITPEGVLQMPTRSFSFSLPSDVNDLNDAAMHSAFYYCSNLASADLSNLITVSRGNSMHSAFRNCTSLTSVDLSNLTTVSGDFSMYFAFSSCTSLASVDLSSLTTVSGYDSMQSAFSSCTSLTSVDLSGLTTVSGGLSMGSTFSGCSNLTSVDLSNLTTVSGDSTMISIFQNCTNLTSVDLSNLTTVSGEKNTMQFSFQNCTSLTSIDLSSLTTVSSYGSMDSAFSSCSSLTSVDLSGLTTLSGNLSLYRIFQNCTSLKTLSFPALTSTSFGSHYTNQFNDMLKGVTGCTVHFPSNLQSVIGSWASVVAGFSGTNTTVLFDLPATEVVSNTHTLTVQINDDYCNYLSLNGTEVSHGRGNYTYTYPSGTTVAVRYDTTSQSNVTTSYVMDQDRTLSIGSSTWVIN